MFSIILTLFAFSATNVYAEDSYIISNFCYTIKNVFSGKYLDVDHANTDNGTNVLQWQYHGGYNQEWRLVYVQGGLYKIVSCLDDNKALTVVNTTGNNGVNITISDYVGTVAQHFALRRTSTTSYKIITNASGYNSAVTVQNASCNNGANVFQWYMNGSLNGEWLIEPENAYISTYGVAYARANYDNYLVTYPNMSSMGGDCANFVSQCMAASGRHFTGDWYINKLNNDNLTPGDSSELDDTWQLSDPSPWISAKEFNTFWALEYGVYTQTYTLDDIINNNASSSKNFTYGDVVQILKKDRLGVYQGYHTMYITDIGSYDDKGSYLLTYHSENKLEAKLVDICKKYKNIEGTYRIRFFDFT